MNQEVIKKDKGWLKKHLAEILVGLLGIGVAIYLFVLSRGSSSTQPTTQISQPTPSGGGGSSGGGAAAPDLSSLDTALGNILAQDQQIFTALTTAPAPGSTGTGVTAPTSTFTASPTTGINPNVIQAALAGIQADYGSLEGNTSPGSPFNQAWVQTIADAVNAPTSAVANVYNEIINNPAAFGTKNASGHYSNWNFQTIADAITGQVKLYNSTQGNPPPVVGNPAGLVNTSNQALGVQANSPNAQSIARITSAKPSLMRLS